MVAEDEDMLRMIAIEFLTDAGFDVIGVAGAADALAILEDQNRQVDVLFTDIHMPGGMDGLELARRVKHSWPNIALLISSGNVWPKHEEMPEGSRFVRKPYELANIVRQVEMLAS